MTSFLFLVVSLIVVSCFYEFVFAHRNFFSNIISFIEFFVKASSKKIAKGIRYLIFTIGAVLLAIILFLVGRYAFSIPILIFYFRS